MKALILSGGKGKEMTPLSDFRPKTMISLHGKPILHHVFDGLSGVGITDFVIVAGQYSEEITSYFRQFDRKVKIKIIRQNEDKPGVAGAIISAAKEFVDEKHVCIAHGDIIAPTAFYTHMFLSLKNTKADGAISVTLKGNVHKYGATEIGMRGFIERIIEHPPEDMQYIGNYVAAGAYIFPKAIFDLLKQEETLEKAINMCISQNYKLVASVWDGCWTDVGSPFQLLDANKTLLSNLEYSRIHKKAMVSPSAHISGPVIIEEGVTIDENTVVVGPAFIGKNVYIGNNCLIRNNACIEANCSVGFSVELKNSVVQKRTKVGRMSFIGDSVIGANSIIRTGVTTINKLKKPHIERGTSYTKLGVVVGDKVEIGDNSVIMPLTCIPSEMIIDPGSKIGPDNEN